MSEQAFCEFLSTRRALLVLRAGRASGERLPLDQARVIVGRGPGVDLALDDSDLAREHAVLEFERGAFHLHAQDVGRAPIVNGEPTRACELKHGDRIELGAQILEFLVEDREPF